MTAEQAIKHLEDLQRLYLGNEKFTADIEAIGIVIKALEQQPCEDCISREHLINKIGSVDGLEGVENSNLFAKHYMDIVKSAPSVTPTRPAGKWEYVQYDTPNIGNWHCSRCRGLYYSTDKPRWKYCPSCGARMEEGEGKDGNTM